MFNLNSNEKIIASFDKISLTNQNRIIINNGDEYSYSHESIPLYSIQKTDCYYSKSRFFKIIAITLSFISIITIGISTLYPEPHKSEDLITKDYIKIPKDIWEARPGLKAQIIAEYNKDIKPLETSGHLDLFKQKKLEFEQRKKNETEMEYNQIVSDIKKKNDEIATSNSNIDKKIQENNLVRNSKAGILKLAFGISAACIICWLIFLRSTCLYIQIWLNNGQKLYAFRHHKEVDLGSANKFINTLHSHIANQDIENSTAKIAS